MNAPSAALRDAILAARPAMLDRDALDAYAPLDPANGRMRAIMDDIFGAGLEQNLWIPASHALLRRPEIGAAADKGAYLLLLVHGARRHRCAPVL